ncbi:MAG TPA: MEDS domain-containing protein [Planctomycetota bacterium]|nr:MEDS domain-containing protein [Planctomycetota bacterium]
MQDPQYRCDFCGSAIHPNDLRDGRAVVVFRRKYCPQCMTAAIQRGKSVQNPNTPLPIPSTTLTPHPAGLTPTPSPAFLFDASTPSSAVIPPAPVPVFRPEAPMPPPAPTPRPAAPRRPAAPAPAGPQSTRRLKVGEHGCGFYSSEEDRRHHLGPYIREGLENGEKVIHFLRQPTPEKILGDFRAVGLNPKPYLDRGQLEIMPVTKMLIGSGAFFPSKVAERMFQASNRALEDGYTRLRIACEMTWALSSQIDIASLVEYERELSALAARGKCTSLCQYNVYRFDATSLHQIRTNHPYVYAKGTAAMVVRELEPAH